jgi:hypothetical protein
MKQQPKYRIITQIISHIADYHRRSAIQRAGVFLAVIWSFVGPVTAGFDSPPLQERLSILVIWSDTRGHHLCSWLHLKPANHV